MADLYCSGYAATVAEAAMARAGYAQNSFKVNGRFADQCKMNTAFKALNPLRSPLVGDAA